MPPLAELRDDAVLAMGAMFFGGKGKTSKGASILRYGVRERPEMCDRPRAIDDLCSCSGPRALCHQKGSVAKKDAPVREGATANETRSGVAGTAGRVNQRTAPVVTASSPMPSEMSAMSRLRCTPRPPNRCTSAHSRARGVCAATCRRGRMPRTPPLPRRPPLPREIERRRNGAARLGGDGRGLRGQAERNFGLLEDHPHHAKLLSLVDEEILFHLGIAGERRTSNRAGRGQGRNPLAVESFRR